MTRFLSHLHDDLRKTRTTQRGATKKAADVPTNTHTTYSRMPRIQLPEPATLSTPLSEVLKIRRSGFMGDPDTDISLQEYGTLLGSSLRINDRGHRPYPSGGALYPVETYLFANRLDGTIGGIFHYNPTAHALERLWNLPEGTRVKDLIPRSEHLDFSALLVFTSVWDRSSAKYGDFTYLLALLEAGHLSQNILLSATALDLAARPMAGFADERIIECLDLDREYEQPIHSITLSKKIQKKS